MVNTKSSLPNAKTHHVRTFFASIFGILAVWLIVTSVLVVWINRTLIDNQTFNQTVTPVVSAPAVQGYIATNITNQLLNGSAAQQLSQSLLTPEQMAGKSPEQIQALVEPIVHSSVLGVVQSAQFSSQWAQSTQRVHDEFVSQLDANVSPLTVDLTPAINEALGDLAHTKLAPVSATIALPAGSAKVSMAGSGLDNVHRYYHILKTGTIGLVLAALLFMVLSVWLSVQHLKTARRILVGTGLDMLLSATLLSVPYFISTHSRPANQQAAFAIADVLLRNLRIATAVIGVVSLLAALGLKLYSNSAERRRPARS